MISRYSTLVLFSSAILLGACAARTLSIAPKSPVSGEIPVHLPSGPGLAVQALGSSLPVFEEQASPDSLAAAQAVASSFGITGAARPTVGGFESAEGTKTLRTFGSASTWMYEDLSKMWGSSGALPVRKGVTGTTSHPLQPSVPDEQSAIDVAKGFIRSHRLAPKGEYQYYQDRELDRSIADPHFGVLVPKEVLQREIVFKGTIGGLVVHGAGPQVSVFIGDSGSVNGVFLNWPSLKAVRTVSVNSPSDALSTLQERIAAINGVVPVHHRISGFSVGKMKLGFVGCLDSAGNKEILPTYAVLGAATVGNQSRARVVFLDASSQAHVPDKAEL